MINTIEEKESITNSPECTGAVIKSGESNNREYLINALRSPENSINFVDYVLNSYHSLMDKGDPFNLLDTQFALWKIYNAEM